MTDVYLNCVHALCSSSQTTKSVTNIETNQLILLRYIIGIHCEN
jgi:hypothetical protein